ncbi:cobalt-zinc-cadmium resistance protein CzcC [Janthinobacterium sp. HH01]|uniref:TolC family protein n=1 Tax=Oxalobacteraceae TaxID=75682 RepID=UPI0002AEC7D0|nr:MULTISPECIES: TolC family protein [Oxalobacteraceae]ELX08355.1 cobalt-zinc-cadmium resistance protein CzcC [Janthinobacterium sp. HH01]OEZ53806.1 cobalt-zinc-cadmium resistance protein CzcC precursor [Duganella sp. HH105]
MQSRYFVMGAAVLLAQLISFSTQAAEQQGASFTIGESARSIDPSTAPLTLEQAITQALSTSPQLRSAAQSVAIAEGARVQAGMRPNPELSLLREGMSSTTGRTDTYQLSQLLELGDKRGARIKFAEQDQAFARGDTNVAAAELRANVIAAYFEALTAREHVALAKESLTLASKATNAAGRRVAAGKISPLEQTRSSVAEAGARLELSQALADAALAKRRLAAFWGSTQPEARPLVAPEINLAAIPALPELQTRLEASPQMQRARIQIAREEARLNLAKADRVPDLTVTLGRKKDSLTNVSQTVVGVAIPLPLFNRNQGNLLSALRRVDKARTDAEIEYLNAIQALADAHQRATVSQEQIESMRKEILPAAQSAFDAAVTGFELGKFGFIDVLDAQRTLFQSRAQYLSALSARFRSLADLERFIAVENNVGNLPTDRNTK